jgi:hypothetical protein
MGVTGAMGAATSIISAQQKAGQDAAQAQAAGNEATIAQQQARTAQQIAVAQEGTQLQKNAQIEGAQVAAIAQSGTGVTSGSAQDVMRQTAINDQLDRLNIRYQGKLEAHGYSTQAEEARTAQGVLRSNASNARLSGYLGAGQALLGTGTSYASGCFGPTPSWMPKLQP